MRPIKKRYGLTIIKDDGSFVDAPNVIFGFEEALDIADIMRNGDGIRNVVPFELTSAPKQVILVRTDLNMRKGKIAAQAAHASMGVLLQMMKRHDLDQVEERVMYVRYDSALREWLDGSFTKICLGVSSEEELVSLYEKAREQKLDACLIEDNGLTEFHGVKTKTCVAIGPDYPELIDKITKHLKLL
jgi:PTH2 family peptidyl-tRNA hydrolase